jgi:hypothetical protein
MPLVFFSGGIDSTVLTFDLAQHPYRYGIDAKSDELLLLTVGDEKKKRALRPILAALEKVTTMRPVVRVVSSDVLHPRPEAPPQAGGMMSLVPAVTRYEPDLNSFPYTPALHLWMASIAMNMVFFRDRPPSMSPPKAFFGFQCDGPMWRAHDEGQLPLNDVSPWFVGKLNEIAAGLKEPEMTFHAPFLDARMDRTQIVQMGLEVGAPLELTSSCIRGWKVNCGICCQCLNRQKAFRYLGVKYE